MSAFYNACAPWARDNPTANQLEPGNRVEVEVEPHHLQRIVDGQRTFIEWSVAFDAEPGQADSWRDLLLSLIAAWTGSLKGALARNSI
jgi:hypothetical protein